MSDSNQFPILFTVGNSNRHEVTFLSPSTSQSDLFSSLESLISDSPNATDALHKYSKQQGAQRVKGVKVRWSGEPREAKLWPSATIVTQKNIEAVLSLVALHGGKDVLEVEVEREEEKGKGEGKE